MMTVVITGTNKGIGLALTQKYLSVGYEVFALCRKASEDLKKTSAHIVEGIDVGRNDCLELVRKKLTGVKIDLLINNSGIWRTENLPELNYNTMVEQFEVNALGPLRVSEALVEQMVKGSKIAMITSRMGSIADNDSGGRYGYRMSKAALNAGSKSLAIDLRGKGISVITIHPGYVQTDMTDGKGDLTTKKAAEGIFQRIEELTLETSGRFFHSQGSQLPW